LGSPALGESNVPIFRRKQQADAPATASRPTPPAPAPRSDNLPAPHFAPEEGDPVLVELLETAKAKDWPAIRATLAGFDGYDFSSLMANMCSRAPEMDDWLPGAVGDGAGDALARAVLGGRKVERGWEIRTGARASHVSQEQFAAFHAHLRDAEEYLYDAADLDRSSTGPWYYLMISARGLQVGLPVTRRRFEALVTRSPGHIGAHRQMLQSLCKKWSGSHEQMHAFATEAMRGPHGLHLGEIAAFAHLEHWLDLKAEERRAYITAQSVRAELLEAADRSIFNPDYAMPRAPHHAFNLFALMFCLAGLHEQSRAAFKATGGVVTKSPWHYFNAADPIAAYAKRREIAFQNA
jgi:hypothetical protein